MHRSDILLSIEKALVLVACAGTLSLILFIALSAWSSSKMKSVDQIGPVVGACFVFGVLGIVIGITMGSSRTPVVDTVLPAALSFIGGVALFVITRDKSDFVIVSAAVVGFSVLMFVGTILGAFERNRAIIQAKYDLKRLTWEAETEFAINAYRDSMGLAELDFSK